jgi:hypothetical protein
MTAPMSARDALPVLALCISLTSGCGTTPTMTAAPPQTRAEKTHYEETSRYDDVLAFLDVLARQTPRVRVETFGTSEEGRDLPLVVVGDPPASAPPARSSRLPVVLVMANIHAGEVEGKEAALHLMRRLTLGDLQPLLPSAVWLFAPIYNADGNEEISLDHRVEQNGPIGGVGTRENTKGLDLNRDFMKLESSEARALVALFTRWDPDVLVDLHTTNGSYHGYHLTYGPPFPPNTDPRVAAFTRDSLLPVVREAMHTRHGFRTFDYGNFTTADAIDEELEGFKPGETRQKVWRTFDARPRFGTNYAGLRNRIAILSEAYSYLDFERRVKATEAFTEEIMRFVTTNGDAIRSLTTLADANWVAPGSGREQGIASKLQALPKPVDVLVGAIDSKVNPRSGKACEPWSKPPRFRPACSYTTGSSRPPRAVFLPSTSSRSQATGCTTSSRANSVSTAFRSRKSRRHRAGRSNSSRLRRCATPNERSRVIKPLRSRVDSNSATSTCQQDHSSCARSSHSADWSSICSNPKAMMA